MHKIGIIDIGSNSVRLVIVNIYTGGYFKILKEYKESVRLVKDISNDKRLSSERIKHAISVLEFFKNICISSGANEIIAVATAAVRASSNQKEFVAIVKEELDIEIQILSGLEEAYYDYYGTVCSLAQNDGLIMDIGGGSTELIWVKERNIKESISLPFGAITLADRFNISDIMNESTEEDLYKYILEEYDGVSWLKNIRQQPLIGIGGTIRNIGKIDRKRRSYPLDFTHGYKMESRAIEEIFNNTKTLSLKQRKKTKGLSKERADIFVGAAAAVSMLVKYCESSEFIVSGSGLREGIIYDYITKGKAHIYDVLDFSLNNIMAIHEINKKHSENVWKLAEALFDGLRQLHCIDKSRLKVLKAAALLHELGIDISYYNNHKHSFYMILNSGLNGLDHKEILMTAYVAALHRKDDFKVDACYKSVLTDDELNIIRELALMLKISNALDIAEDGNVERLHLTITDDNLLIKIDSKKDHSAEIKYAAEAAPAFKEVYSKKLIIM